ncbi:L,D-transpeptidase family protein [Mucilaginibacter roseus]|uniref:L,D-transpeptidase family protein n=1 Tax=Mucilaginibacter roseus TaxID=1528868 RepID=A0ABS8U2X8_9SPHI|nr:L,D-transpeptidase family protein [Mucilaginibacter roseus]MCD8740415.1 L,D-transpeptidase family protein [Mucilaginibacter roseus]
MTRLALIITVVVLSTAFTSFTDDAAFMRDQKRSARVKQAYNDKEKLLNEKLKPYGLSLNGINILITAFKTEQHLTVYIKAPAEAKYRKFKTYSVCSMSGVLGPKRRSGDGQVPEGFYYIDRFNPASAYYLSLGLNYPNAADKIRSGKANPGGDIFIHGKCVTVGCLPVTDDYIKEIYVLALQAYQSGQHKIPVYIFPYKFDSISADRISSPYASDKNIIAFWDKLKKGYNQFNARQQELAIRINPAGDYIFN